MSYGQTSYQQHSEIPNSIIDRRATYGANNSFKSNVLPIAFPPAQDVTGRRRELFWG